MRLCDFGEFGHKESQRYRHIYLTHAACGAVGDALGCGGRIFDQFLEPTAPLRNPSNQRPLSCQTEWDAGAAAMVRRAEEFRISRRLLGEVLVQGMWSLFVPSGWLPFAVSVWFNSTIN